MARKSAKPPDHIPRLPNSFILYRSHLALHIQRDQGLGLTQRVSVTSKFAGAEWRKESKEVKDFWERKTERAKAIHELMFPGYKYQPDRSGNKKTKLISIGFPCCTVKFYLFQFSISSNTAVHMTDTGRSSLSPLNSWLSDYGVEILTVGYTNKPRTSTIRLFGDRIIVDRQICDKLQQRGKASTPNLKVLHASSEEDLMYACVFLAPQLQHLSLNMNSDQVMPVASVIDIFIDLSHDAPYLKSLRIK